MHYSTARRLDLHAAAGAARVALAKRVALKNEGEKVGDQDLSQNTGMRADLSGSPARNRGKFRLGPVTALQSQMHR